MVIRRKSSNMGIKTPLGICILAGAATGTLVAMIATMSTATVQADTEFSRPAVTLASVPPAPTTAPAAAAIAAAQSPTPAFLAPQKTATETVMEKRKDALRGLASWYGGVFNGRRTASGEKFDMNALTACHPTLPFGSLVRVVNLHNKHSVVVRINDRGDLIDEGRIIDLSKAAAERLSMTKSGLAKVKLEVISLGRNRGQD
jgi:rare lipoprotein A